MQAHYTLFHARESVPTEIRVPDEELRGIVDTRAFKVLAKEYGIKRIPEVLTLYREEDEIDVEEESERSEEEGDVESEESADEARSEDMRLEEEAEHIPMGSTYTELMGKPSDVWVF